MGLSGPNARESDPYVAYCFDDAIYQWGNYIEDELREATSKTKNEKQAKSKATMRLKTLLAEREEDENLLFTPPPRRGVLTVKSEDSEKPPAPAPRKFRDPASLFKK